MSKLDNLHNVAISAKNLRVFRERYAKMSRPKFAEILGIPPTTLKNYELGYREVGGAFLVALAHHPELHKFTLWLLADKKVAEIGQIGPDDIAKA